MRTFDLKLIAILTMVIDHIGVFFFPDVLMFRIIGRLSFPLFAWLIVNGIEYSHDRRKYFLRLFVFAVISQLPYLLAFGAVIPGFSGLNIFFTLCLGFLAVQAYRVVKTRIYSFLLIVLCALGASLLTTSYGAGGVFCVLAFYVFRQNLQKLFMAQLAIFLAFFTIHTFIIPSMQGNLVALVQPVGALSVLLIAYYNQKQGPKLQYLFYMFYPLHLLVLYFLYETLS